MCLLAGADKPKGRYDDEDDNDDDNEEEEVEAEEATEEEEDKEEEKAEEKEQKRARVLLRGYTNIASSRVNCKPLESYKCTACRIYFVGAHIS